MISCNIFLSTCSNILQLPDGRWVGREIGKKIYVTVYQYPKGVTPEKHPKEMCREANMEDSLAYYKLRRKSLIIF